MRPRSPILPLFACALGVGLACGGKKTPVVPLRPPVATASVSASSSAVVESPRPPPIPAVSLGTFGEGTFGPRRVRGTKGGLVISAPRSTTGRRWIAYSIDEADHPSEARHEVAEAPEDSSAWDVKAIGEGYVLAWTRPTDAGPQLLTVALAADGSPRSAPTVLTRSSEELVAVRIHPLPDGTGAAALVTYGEKATQKGGIVATGTLQAFALDALGRALGPTPTKVAERLSAWQVSVNASGAAVVGFVQRLPEGTKPKEPKDPAPTSFTGQDDQPRAARAVVLTTAGKSLTLSDVVTLTTNDTALPEIDVMQTGPGRALIVWADRRDLDAHVFAAPLEVSSKPKLAAPARRAVPPRGDQMLVGLVGTPTGAVVLYETVNPRATHEPRRRFDLVRLSPDGESIATPRGILFPYDDDEPELVAVKDTDEVAMLTYGSACTAIGGAPASCDKKDLRPMIVRFGGATLVPKQVDLLDVGNVVGGAAMHAFDLGCTPARCDALVDGPGNPTTVALAKVATRASEPKEIRWVFDELVETSATPPRLEAATTLGRESQFAGLHATKAGTGTLVGWVTYFADDAEVETAPPIEIKSKKEKGKKGDKDKDEKPKPKPKAKKKDADQGARVAVRLLDGTGEPVAPIAVVSERALSKGDIALAWSALDKGGALVAYVSRAEGDEEVYIASVDGKGKKSGKSSRITHANGAASDVTMVALPPPEGGWLLAWVDGRKDTSAVYAVRIDKGGQKVGSEVKIGGGLGGDVSDVSLAVIGTGAQGPRVAVVWSDARDDATHGFADIYVTVVSGKDPSKALVPEKPLVKTKMHSHNAVIAPRGDGGALVGWLEDDPSASEMLELTGKPEWGAYVARIDGSGSVVQSSTLVSIDAALGKGIVTGIAADCVSSTCRLALAWGDREGIALLAANVPASGAVTARSVWSYHGAPTQEVAPALVGNTAYLCEDGLEKDDGRVRRLSIGW